MSNSKSYFDFQSDENFFIDDLLQRKFEKKYSNFKDFEKDFLETIEKAHNDIEEDKYIPLKDAIKELQSTYGILC